MRRNLPSSHGHLRKIRPCLRFNASLRPGRDASLPVQHYRRRGYQGPAASTLLVGTGLSLPLCWASDSWTLCRRVGSLRFWLIGDRMSDWKARALSSVLTLLLRLLLVFFCSGWSCAESCSSSRVWEEGRDAPWVACASHLTRTK